MTKDQLDSIRKGMKQNEMRTMCAFLAGDDRYVIRVLCITADDYWFQDEDVTMDEFLDIISGSDSGDATKPF